MKRKEKTYITTLVILALGLIISIKSNWHFTKLLKETKLKLSKREIELNSVLWASGQCYLYNGCKIEDFKLINTNGKGLPLSSILDNNHKEFFKFSSSDCIECVEAELQLLKERVNPIKILVETRDTRWLKAFIKSNHIAFNTVFRIEQPILEDAELPFYFVTNSELYIRDVFFPIKELPDFSINYHKAMRNKYSK